MTGIPVKTFLWTLLHKPPALRVALEVVAKSAVRYRVATTTAVEQLAVSATLEPFNLSVLVDWLSEKDILERLLLQAADRAFKPAASVDRAVSQKRQTAYSATTTIRNNIFFWWGVLPLLKEKELPEMVF